MTPAALVALIVGAAILSFFSALFSGLETALFALKQHQLLRLEEHHPSLREFIRVFRENPRRVLNMLLFGDAVVKVPLIVLCLVLLWSGPIPKPLPQWLAATLIFTLLVILCDLLPKLFALSAP